jgi:hypothetical protein
LLGCSAVSNCDIDVVVANVINVSDVCQWCWSIGQCNACGVADYMSLPPPKRNKLNLLKPKEIKSKETKKICIPNNTDVCNDMQSNDFIVIEQNILNSDKETNHDSEEDSGDELMRVELENRQHKSQSNVQSILVYEDQYVYEGIMSGFRVYPAKNDKNDKEDSCKLYFEKIKSHTSSKGPYVKLNWNSFDTETITLSDYDKHQINGLIWPFGTKQTIHTQSSIIEKARDIESTELFRHPKETNNKEVSNDTTVPLTNSSLNIVCPVDLSNQPLETIPISLDDETISISSQSPMEDHTENSSRGTTNIKSVNADSNSIKSKRSESSLKNETEILKELKTLYSTDDIDRVYSVNVCGKMMKLSTFRFPVANTVLDIESRQPMFFIDMAKDLDDKP